MNHIPFNKPTLVGTERQALIDSISLSTKKFSGDGFYSQECQKWLEKNLSIKKVLLTPSCTQALEMCALLLNISPGDEIIMPSYTFVSTANAFLLRGAKIKFVDINPFTMNVDELLLEDAITDKTKAIVVVNYAGISCDLSFVKDLCLKYKIPLIEDAAQSIMAKYQNRYLGTFGDLATFSFHETKNIHCGEGGALLINNSDFIERSEIVREKGTNRSKFFRGQIDKYTWVELGSSYLPSDIASCFLLEQLKAAYQVTEKRKFLCDYYSSQLIDVSELSIFKGTENHIGNGHIFYIKVKNLEQRTKLLEFLNESGINAVFHYIPLHSSPMGKEHTIFHGEDRYTTKESERLIRLPLFYDLNKKQIDYIVSKIKEFFRGF